MTFPRVTSRYLFGFTSLCLAGGAIFHTSAFQKASSLIDTLHAPAFFTAVLKGLWLCNSVTLVTVALLFGCLAVQPRMMAKPLVVLLACLLFAFAGLIYASVGSFFAGHALLAAGIAALLGAIAAREPAPGLVGAP